MTTVANNFLSFFFFLKKAENNMDIFIQLLKGAFVIQMFSIK